MRIWDVKSPKFHKQFVASGPILAAIANGHGDYKRILQTPFPHKTIVEMNRPKIEKDRDSSSGELGVLREYAS